MNVEEGKLLGRCKSEMAYLAGTALMFSGTDKDYEWTKISIKISITPAINPSSDELSYSNETHMRPNSDVDLNLVLYLRSSTFNVSGRFLSSFVTMNLTFR